MARLEARRNEEITEERETELTAATCFRRTSSCLVSGSERPGLDSLTRELQSRIARRFESLSGGLELRVVETGAPRWSSQTVRRRQVL